MPEKTADVFLDANHSHFILVDSKKSNINEEILFRARLETELRKTRLHQVEYKKSIKTQLSNPSSVASSDDESKVESEFDNKFNTPMIQICVHGGYDTLLVLQESLKQRVPILVLSVIINQIFLFLHTVQHR